MQEDPRTIVYCAVPKQPANQQPDELTRIIQKKFYNHQSALFSTILESATISAKICSKMNTIEISMPEFINPFQVYFVKTIPLAHNTTNRMYATLKLENKYVAVDPAGNTFLY
ncbi:MAG: hypothetical protein ACK559_13295, partial [bacterium]